LPSVARIVARLASNNDVRLPREEQALLAEGAQLILTNTETTNSNIRRKSMRIMKIKRVIALAVLLSVAGLTGLGYTYDSPSNEEVAFAQKTSDLMLNELLAALFQEFNETTPDNVEHGKQAISLIFNDANRDMRLIGIFPPLQGGFND